jgi:hypothetical protein
MRPNVEPIGLIAGHKWRSPVHVEAFTIEVEPAGLVTRGLKCHFDRHLFGDAFQSG